MNAVLTHIPIDQTDNKFDAACVPLKLCNQVKEIMFNSVCTVALFPLDFDIDTATTLAY